MIFLTVGTTKFPFVRLLQAVDRALISSGLKENLIVQVGPNAYQFHYQNIKSFLEIPFPKMISYLSRARLVITHGGAGTIFLALKYAKNKSLVIPRSKKFNEHVDDHQIFLAKFLKKKKLIEAVFPDEDLATRIGDYLKFPEKLPPKRRAADLKKLVKKLIDYTESIR